MVPLCSLSRLLATAHKLVRQLLVQRIDLFCSLLDPVWSADWTEHGSATMYVVKDSERQWCPLVVHFPCGHWCTVGVLAGTHRCALTLRVASRQSANLCGCWSVLWWSAKLGQRDCTLLFLYVFRASCLATTLDSRSLECENTYSSGRLNIQEITFLSQLLRLR